MSQESELPSRHANAEDVIARFQRIVHSGFIHEEHGLTKSQVFTLRYLATCSQVKASDIAKVSGLSPGAVTQVCDELVRMGLVERTRSADDRRVVQHRITEAGLERFNAIRKVRNERVQAILDQLGQPDADNFIRIVNRIVEIVERNSPEKR